MEKKKEEGETKSPSVIGDTLNKLEELKNRVQELEKENESLKRTIETRAKIDDVSKKFIQEKIQVDEAKKQAEKKLEQKSTEIQTLETKIADLEKFLQEKNNAIKAREKALSELKSKYSESSTKSETTIPSFEKPDSIANIALVGDLKSEISKLKSSIKYYEVKINELMEENDALHEQLIEKYTKLTIDYVVPVETPKQSTKKSPLPQPPSLPLESLCQDLQTELNRYKKRIENLKEENLTLKNLVEKESLIKEDSGEFESITNENEELKIKISTLEHQLKEKSDEAQLSPLLKESENKVKELQGQLKERDRTISEVKALKLSPPPTAKSPVSDLVDELQGTINKLKVSLKEKDKIIEELKK